MRFQTKCHDNKEERKKEKKKERKREREIGLLCSFFLWRVNPI